MHQWDLLYESELVGSGWLTVGVPPIQEFNYEFMLKFELMIDEEASSNNGPSFTPTPLHVNWKGSFVLS